MSLKLCSYWHYLNTPPPPTKTPNLQIKKYGFLTYAICLMSFWVILYFSSGCLAWGLIKLLICAWNSAPSGSSSSPPTSEYSTNKKKYTKFPKYSDTPKICRNHSKILTMWLYHKVMSPNDADGMANSVDPDQTARSLIWVCTVCPGISVRKLRIIRVMSKYLFMMMIWVLRLPGIRGA